ncbi:chemotaxis protein [Rhizobium sp. R693]|nr:chemotaxis protein [Rhizobium sp. R693]
MSKILAVASIVVIASLCGFAFYIDKLQQHVGGQAVESEIKIAGLQSSQSISNWLRARLMLTELAGNLASKAKSQAEISAAFDNPIFAREFVVTYVGDEQGAYTSVPLDPVPADYDPRKRPWYKDAVKLDKLVLTDPYMDVSSHDLVISAAVPVKRDGKLIGVAGSDFSLHSLVAMVNSVDIGGKGSAFIVKADGTVLVHPDIAFVTKKLSEIFTANTPVVGPGLSEATLNGRTVLISFAPITGLPGDDWYVAVTVDRDLAYAGISKFRLAAAVATIISVIALIGVLAVVLSQLVVRPVLRMTDAMGRLAGGEMSADIPGTERKDEIGRMAAAVAIFRSNAIERNRLSRDAEKARSEAEADRFERDAVKAKEVEDVAAAVSALGEGLQRLSSGDLLCRIETPFSANLDRLRTDFNDSVSSLLEAMATVGQNARAIDSGAIEIRSSADSLARRTEQQAASVEETAAALEEITTTVQDSARRAEEVGQLVARARSGAERSGDIVRRAVSAMEDIERSSEEISSIIGVIEEIAFQTNLLALNAGVEAARAGEAGKGFAVVAQEVRELAQRSATAAKDIKGLIESSGEQVGAGVELVNQTGEALSRIVQDVTEINGHISAIVLASREQSTGLQEINKAVSTMDHGTQQNAAMVEEQTAASHSLAAEAAALTKLLANFKLDRQLQAQHRTDRPEFHAA